jgi:hypothetical protein
MGEGLPPHLSAFLATLVIAGIGCGFLTAFATVHGARLVGVELTFAAWALVQVNTRRNVARPAGDNGWTWHGYSQYATPRSAASRISIIGSFAKAAKSRA